MRNNGRYTASEELIALGGGDLINLTDLYCTHKDIDFQDISMPHYMM